MAQFLLLVVPKVRGLIFFYFLLRLVCVDEVYLKILNAVSNESSSGQFMPCGRAS